jgi:hypothetical protein
MPSHALHALLGDPLLLGDLNGDTNPPPRSGFVQGEKGMRASKGLFVSEADG